MNQIEKAKERLSNFLKWNFHLALDDIEITDEPGYWREKEACAGLKGGCRNPLHGYLFNEGPIYHTIQYLDPGRVNGRFSSPYITWKILREATS